MDANMGRFVAHSAAGLFYFVNGLVVSYIHSSEVWNSDKKYQVKNSSCEHILSQEGISRHSDTCSSKLDYLGNSQPSKNKMKFVNGVVAIVSITAGILLEGFGGYVYMSGFFHQLAHQMLYFSLYPWACAFILESGYFIPGYFEDVKLVTPLYSVTGAMLAFTCHAIMLSGHAETKHSSSEVATHEIMSINANITLLLTALAFLGIATNNRGLIRTFYVAAPIGIILSGFWLMSFAFLLYYCEYDLKHNEVYSIYFLELISISTFQALSIRKYFLQTTGHGYSSVAQDQNQHHFKTSSDDLKSEICELT